MLGVDHCSVGGDKYIQHPKMRTGEWWGREIEGKALVRERKRDSRTLSEAVANKTDPCKSLLSEPSTHQALALHLHISEFI